MLLQDAVDRDNQTDLCLPLLGIRQSKIGEHVAVATGDLGDDAILRKSAGFAILPAMNAPLETVLADLRAGLAVLYGDRLDRVILFGSRARGDAEPDSDIDVMIVLKVPADWRAEKGRYMPLATELSLKYDAVIMPFVTDMKTYAESDYSVYENIRREGVVAA